MRPTHWLYSSILFGPSILTLLLPSIVQAQVTIDGTLNTAVNSTNGLDFAITNGSAAGRNLFHSFGEFSIPTDGSATFDLSTTPDIATIFSRVTGPNASTIDGLLQTVNGNNPVSLFLLNPQGVLFGPNASLDIGGAFLATTAATVKFADGNTFSTTSMTPLLTMSVPIGLQMGQNPGPITQSDTYLEVAEGQAMSFIGNDVTIGSGELLAPAGRITIGSLGPNGQVDLAADGSLSNWRDSPFGDIAIGDQGRLEVSGNGGGSIALLGRRIQLSDGTAIISNTLGANNGGNIRINATERLEISGTNPDESDPTGILARARPGSTGRGSTITIVTPQLALRGGAQIVSRADSSGNAGNITVQAQNILAIGESAPDQAYPTGIISRTEATATGRGGDVTIAADTVQILDGAELRASSRGAGRAGNFTVRARTLTTDSQGSTSSLTGISTSTRRGTGDGGDILLEVDDLKILGGAAIRTGSGAGKSGDIQIRAQQVTLQGDDIDGYRAELYTFAESTAKGDAGNIQIDTDGLRILDGAVLSANTSGPMNAGNIVINANTLDLAGTNRTGLAPSLIQSAVTPGSTGQGGQITINSRDRIQLSDGSQINTATFGTGNAGDIRLDATTITITGATSNGDIVSSISASAENVAINGGGNGQTVGRATGNGGAITIRADRLRIADGAEIRSTTEGDGNAGAITATIGQLEVTGSRFAIARNTELSSNINANVGQTSLGQGGRINVVADQVRVSDGAIINSSTFGTGNAGGINIQANKIDLVGKSLLSDRRSSIFSGSQQGTGNAGKIDLTVRDRLFAQLGIISTETTNGQGGMITIGADRVELTAGSQIDSSTRGSGNAGVINLTSDRAQLQQGSLITSQSVGQGNGGTVNLVVRDLALGGRSVISSESTAAGTAGNVVVRSGDTIQLDEAQITSRSSGSGDGGSIDLSAATLRLQNNATINAQTTSGNGGNVDLNLTNLLQLRDRSVISAAAGGNGNGGNIRLSAPFIIGLRNSDIVANAIAGNGGNIQITTDGIFGLKYRPDRTIDNDITASSQFGVNGNVQIQVLSIDPSNSLAALPIAVVDRSNQIDSQCDGSQGGSFALTGRGGLPENPMQVVQSATVWQDRRMLAVGPSGKAVAADSRREVERSVGVPLAEATGWGRGANGQVELVARSANSGRSGFQASCAIAGVGAKHSAER